MPAVLILVISCSLQLLSQGAETHDGVLVAPGLISVSGLSSGADFAVQFQVAFSERIAGAGIFAGQPYHCAVQRFEGDELQPPSPDVPICDGCPAGKTLPYDHCKHNASVVDVMLLSQKARDFASKGLIDDVANLSRARVYLYRGTKDSHYGKGSVDKTRAFFAEFVPIEQILHKNETPSEHAYPLPGHLPWICGAPVIPFQNCAYDGPGAALQHIYGGTLAAPAKAYVSSSLKWFDQSPFFGDRDVTGLDDTGRIYIPKKCQAGSGKLCDLHINFHGCGFTSWPVFEMLVTQLNFNDWAETNDIVVLYPRLKSHGSTKETQGGCWNVYGQGQSGQDYDTRGAPQMAAIRQMVDQIGTIITQATSASEDMIAI